MTEQYPDEGFRKIGDYFISIKKMPAFIGSKHFQFRVKILQNGKEIFRDTFKDKEAAWDSIDHFVEDKKNGR